MQFFCVFKKSNKLFLVCLAFCACNVSHVITSLFPKIELIWCNFFFMAKKALMLVFLKTLQLLFTDQCNVALCLQAVVRIFLNSAVAARVVE